MLYNEEFNSGINCTTLCQFPALTHLRLSVTNRANPQTAAGYLIYTAGTTGILSRSDTLKLTITNHPDLLWSLPKTIGRLQAQIIVIEAGDDIINDLSRIMREEARLFEQAPGCFVLRSHRPEPRAHEANPAVKAEWLERLVGKAGCWTPEANTY